MIRSKNDYYRILDIDRTATKEEIKSQYRKLILKFHPDRNKLPSALKHFTKVREAYEILSDPQKRENYDLEYFGNSIYIEIPIKFEFYRNGVRMKATNLREFFREAEEFIDKE
ncbi:MAG: DnaJ domain-containing protein [Nitrososphaeraceae archaeon]